MAKNNEQSTTNVIQNKAKQTQFKLEAKRKSLWVSFLESSNQRPIKACPERSPEYVEGRSRMGQFQNPTIPSKQWQEKKSLRNFFWVSASREGILLFIGNPILT